MILLIDNYDSFVYNLARYVERLGHEAIVVRNDAIDVEQVASLRPRAILLSPGPRTPNEAGCCVDIVRVFRQTIPLLGICLGHQAIAAAFGGTIVRAASPMHGRTSEIEHSGTGLFTDLPNPLVGCRYHSLVVEEESLPQEFQIDARSSEGEIMAISHRDLRVYGLQFHPEAILSKGGYSLLNQFFRIAGLKVISESDLPDGEFCLPRATPENPFSGKTPPDKKVSTPLTF